MSETLHHRLRAATAHAHAALEQGLDWQARVATLSGYRSLLARMRGFHAAWEPAIAAALDDDAFFTPRRRLASLDADLARLELSPEAIAALPSPAPVTLEGSSGGLGALYVLEGSTLGGQVIGRHIAALHGLDAQSGCAYYHAHGRATGAMWQSFRARLETLSGDAEAENAALTAATDTFDRLRLWLSAP